MDQEKKLAVFKYGSSCVATEEGFLDHEKIDGYVEQLAAIQSCYDLVVVSSGSIAVGTALWHEQHPYVPAPPDQNLATIGSALATAAWQESFAKRGITAGQIAVTHHEIDDESEGAMLRNTMLNNLKHGIVSIVNENDALSDEEIKLVSYGGDNDGVAKEITRKLGADILCLLTANSEGLLNEHDELVQIVRPRYIKDALDAAGEEAGKFGSGGMKTKVIAAFDASAGGARAYIARADRPLKGILNRDYGTYFPPH